MSVAAVRAGGSFRGIAPNVLSMPRPKTDNSIRFKNQFTKAGPDECWLWTGQTINSGYGTFWVEGTKRMTAHRFAFQAANGYLPLVVRHACDVKLCVNPSHLLPGTMKDNMQDMSQRHRMGGGNVKLTADQVEDIRRRFVSGDHGRGGNRRQLAVEFGVNAKHIWRIATGRTGDYRLSDPKRSVLSEH
jgi:hypothetical protein